MTDQDYVIDQNEMRNDALRKLVYQRHGGRPIFPSSSLYEMLKSQNWQYVKRCCTADLFDEAPHQAETVPLAFCLDLEPPPSSLMVIVAISIWYQT